MCDQLSKVVDVFFSKKLSRIDKRFGFVHFSGVRDDDVMVKQLCDIWFGYHKIYASLFRLFFQNGHVSSLPPIPSKAEKRYTCEFVC